MHRRFASTLLLLASLLASVVGAAATARVETVAEGLSFPWSLAFLPDGDFLITERGGRLLRLTPDGRIAAEIEGVPEVLVAGQGGLFDVLLAPDFERSRTLVLSYAHGAVDDNALRVSTATLDGDRLVDARLILEVSPTKSTPQHYGGRLAFLPDGTLLVTSGEGFDHREDAQRLDHGLGKILRVRLDGGIPADNPFVEDPDAQDAIWSYGHRNPQGLAVAADGTVWEHEHGPAGGDEVNRIEPGLNYGWPIATHGMDYSGAHITPFETYPGMVEPLHFWTPSIAPSGLAIYDGEAFPEWRGDLFVGGLAILGVYRVDVENGAVRGAARVLPTLDERIRDLRSGPDGSLWILTDADPGRLLRVVADD